MKQFSMYNEGRKVHDLENVKLKLKMISKNSKSSKVSVDDYISNILGTGLNISKPSNFSKIESQSAQNLRSDRNSMLNGNEFNNSSVNISSSYSLITESMTESDLFSNLPFAYREIINRVRSPNGELDTQQIYQLFISSGLSMNILGSIWSVINRTSPGQLTVFELSVGLAMVALYQEQSFPDGTVHAFNPLTWDQVILRNKFPVPRLPTVAKAPDTSNGVDLSNIYLPNNHTISPAYVETSTDNDNWADFSSFVSFDQGPQPIIDISVSKPGVTTYQPIIEIEKGKQSYDIQKQINNQFSSWQNNIKSENACLNVFQIGNSDQSQTSTITSKLPEGSSVLLNGSAAIPITTHNKSNVDSDFGDFQLFSSNEPAFANDIPNRNSPKTVVTDRYQIFESELTDSHNSLNDQWLRCLNQCHNIIADTVKTLNRVTDDSIKIEIFNSEKGNLLLAGIIEVYRVTRNIKLSTSKTNILSSSSSLVGVFTNIEKHWNDFMLYLPDEMQIDVQRRLSKGSQNSDLNLCPGETLPSSECCGVCLCVLHPDEGFLSHGLRRYHCPCANLWVNTLDLTLPGLCFESL